MPERRISPGLYRNNVRSHAAQSPHRAKWKGRFHEIVGYGEYGSWGRFLADECQGRTDGSADAGTTASILTVMLDTLGCAKC